MLYPVDGSCSEWNESFLFSISSDVPELKIKLMDKDTFTADDFIGEATWVIYNTHVRFLLMVYVYDQHWCLSDSWIFLERRIPLQPLFVENSLPPMAYHVVKDEEYRGEVRVALTFTPQVWDILPIIVFGLCICCRVFAP